MEGGASLKEGVKVEQVCAVAVREEEGGGEGDTGGGEEGAEGSNIHTSVIITFIIQDNQYK